MRAVATRSFVSTFRLRRRSSAEAALRDADYVAAGKRLNDTEFREAGDQPLLRLWHEEEGFGWLLEVPFAFKQLIDLHAALRHAVAVTGERHQALTRHAHFHAAFTGFALGFAQGLISAHRRKHLRWHGLAEELSLLHQEQCDQWGVEIATYYIAAVDVYGIFGKATDLELYGITDKWWTLGDPSRLEGVPGVQQCVEAGRSAAVQWSEDERIDVSSGFADALGEVVAAAQELS